MFEKNYEKPYTDEINANYMKSVKTMVKEYFATKPLFNELDIKLYSFDEYKLNTDSFDNIPHTIYVEIDCPNNYKNSTIQVDKNGGVKAPNLYLTLQKMKKDWQLALLKYFDNNTTIWLTNYSVDISTTIEDDDGNEYYYPCRIIPCLTYYNQNDCHGVLYYNDYLSQAIIEYPKTAYFNYKVKNMATNDLFMGEVLYIKSLYMEIENLANLPSEIFETLLYNVPDEYFKLDEEQTLIDCIKYLMKVNPKSLKSLDEQDCAFSCPTRAMSLIYVRHVLKVLQKYLKISIYDSNSTNNK